MKRDVIVFYYYEDNGISNMGNKAFILEDKNLNLVAVEEMKKMLQELHKCESIIIANIIILES